MQSISETTLNASDSQHKSDHVTSVFCDVGATHSGFPGTRCSSSGCRSVAPLHVMPLSVHPHPHPDATNGSCGEKKNKHQTLGSDSQSGRTDFRVFSPERRKPIASDCCRGSRGCCSLR